MDNLRKIRRIVVGTKTVDGAGVKLVRVIGHNDTKDFDPFLMLDAFDSFDPADYTKGFPWHPHRGIETITYLVHGDIEHADSLKNHGSIKDGDCQWMTAGSGIIHQEMPKASDHLSGVQLWLNLPARYKMTAPRYGDIKKNDIPVVSENGNRIHVVSGQYNNVPGAFQGRFVKATYLDVEVYRDSEWLYNCDNEATIFIYIISGDGYFNTDMKEKISEKHAILFTEGNKIWVKAGDKGMRFILLSGKPLHEPIAWGGPVVMNTQEELDIAFRELDENTFIKERKDL
ncbi:MAG: pirin family protein [Saccharofermentanales bacterium]